MSVRSERPSGERETLERLQGDEAALEREIALARAEAGTRLEGARRQAEVIVAAARNEAEFERDDLRARAAAELQRVVEVTRKESGAAAVELARRAAANRERAVARAIEVVAGRGP